VLMCKKIAQLTKVIYHLNTVNEDHAGELDAVQRQHKSEVQEMLRDAASKLAKFKDAVAGKKDDANARALVEQQKKRHEKEKEQCLQQWKKEMAEGEQKLHADYGDRIAILSRDVANVKAKFSDAAKVFSDAASKMSASQADGNWALEKQKRDSEKASMAAAKEAQKRFEDMVSKHQGVQDDLRAAIEQRERDAARVARLAAEEEAGKVLGRLRAEVHGQKEAALATAKRAAAEDLRAAQADAAKAERAKDDAYAALQLSSRDEAGALAAELAKLRRNVDASKTENLALAAENAALQKDAQRLRDALAAESGDKQAASAGEAATAKVLAELRAQIVGLDRGLEAATARAEGADGRVSALTAELVRVKAELVDTGNTLAAFEARAEKELAQKDAKITELDALLRAARADGESQGRDGSKALAEAQARAAALEADSKAAAANFTALEADLARLQAQASESSADVLARHGAELEAAKAQGAAELKRFHAIHESELQAHDDAAAKAAARLAEDRQKAEAGMQAAHKAEEAAARGELQKLRVQSEGDVEKLRTQMIQLEKELADALARANDDGQLQVAKAANEKLSAELRKSRSQAESLQADVKRHLGIIESLKSQVEDLRQELEASAAAAKIRLEKQKASLEEEWAAKLATAVGRARNALLSDASSASQSARAEMDKLRLELEAAADAALASRTAERDDALQRRAEAEERGKADDEAAKRREAALDEVVAGLHLRVKALEAAAADASKSASEASASLGAELDSARSELEALRRKHDDLGERTEAQICELTNSVKRLQAHVEVASTEVSELRASGDALRGTLSNRDGAITELEKALERTGLDAEARLKSDIAALDADWRRRHAEAADAAAREKTQLTSDAAAAAARASADLVAVQTAAAARLAALAQATEEREVLAEANLASQLRELKASHDDEVESLQAEARRRYEDAVAAADAERRRQTARASELERANAQWEAAYEARESRPEDLEALAKLRQELDAAVSDLQRAKAELVYFKRELINREENFNKRFGAAPNVGVMQVLKQPGAPQTKFLPKKPTSSKSSF